MSHVLIVDVYCALGVSDLLVSIILDDGSTVEAVLRRGHLEARFASRPARLRLETALLDERPAESAPLPRDVPPGTTKFEAARVFGEGVDVPPNGRVSLEIVWDSDCHGELHSGDEEGRFTGYEHIQCATWIGWDSIGADAKQLDAPVEISVDTPFPVGATTLTFGEIICLAGDYFAHLDVESATLFADAWPALAGVAGWLTGEDYRAAKLLEADGPGLRELLTTIHRDGTTSHSGLGEMFNTARDAAFHRHPARRYLALASQNFCHFGSPDPAMIRNEALALYQGYHALASQRAQRAGGDRDKWRLAVVTEAFACHFLTDLCASGHMRTPRRALGERFGIVRGALRMSKAMHDEDNELGLWCAASTRGLGARVVWRAFGDGRLLQLRAEPHLGQVQELVRCSVWEIHEARVGNSVPYIATAAAQIPTPLAPGRGPQASDRAPDGTPYGTVEPEVNHAPLYAILPSGHVGERVGDITSRVYRDLEVRNVPAVRLFD